MYNCHDHDDDDAAMNGRRCTYVDMLYCCVGLWSGPVGWHDRGRLLVLIEFSGGVGGQASLSVLASCSPSGNGCSASLGPSARRPGWLLGTPEQCRSATTSSSISRHPHDQLFVVERERVLRRPPTSLSSSSTQYVH